MSNLYLVSQIEENDGEITEEIAEELAIAESELEDKLRAYLVLRKNMIR